MNKLDDPAVLSGMATPRRRDGFPGQHQVILPPAVVRDALRHPLLRGLLPTDAGLYPCVAGHFVERPEGAPAHILLVCTAGRGWVRVGREPALVTPGGIVLLAPGEPHAYGADDADPWTIEWAHFIGDDAARWRELIHAGESSPAIVRLPAPEAVLLGLAQVHERLESGYGLPQLLSAAAVLRTSLAEIVRRREVPGHAPTVIEAVDATAGWMRSHLGERITLSALARRARLSPSHYSVVFRRRFGFAPIDWLIRQRIQHASQLLDRTEEKVESVGRAVGFADPYYFSRVFRRVMGRSPRAYRAIAKG